jgi:hypothetical protein
MNSAKSAASWRQPGSSRGTPLHMACTHGTVNLLPPRVVTHANMALMNAKWESPLAVAISRQQIACIPLDVLDTFRDELKAAFADNAEKEMKGRDPVDPDSWMELSIVSILTNLSTACLPC